MSESVTIIRTRDASASNKHLKYFKEEVKSKRWEQGVHPAQNFCLSRFLCFFKNAQKSAQQICAFLKNFTVPVEISFFVTAAVTAQLQIQNNCWKLTVHHINRKLATGFVQTAILAVTRNMSSGKLKLNVFFVRCKFTQWE